MDIAEVRTGEGKLFLFVAIDRTSKLAVARLCGEATRRTACRFLEGADRGSLQAPHDPDRQRHPVRPKQPRNRTAILSRLSRFDMICEANGIEHRLTEPNHPRSEKGQPTVRGTVGPTNGQVEPTSRTIKDATTKRCHYKGHDALGTHLDLLLNAYHARRLKTLKGLTPAQLIWTEWQARPDLFHDEPCHLMTGPNTLCVSTLPWTPHRRSRPGPAKGWDTALNTLWPDHVP